MSAHGAAGRDRRLRADRRQAGRRRCARRTSSSAAIDRGRPNAPRRSSRSHGGQACAERRRAARARARRRDRGDHARPARADWPSRRCAAGCTCTRREAGGASARPQIERLIARRAATPAGSSRLASTTAFTRRSPQLAAEVHSGEHGELMHLRARYGHGGRLGYDREWRAQPERSGGGELIDQGMHLLDLTSLAGGPAAAPLRAAADPFLGHAGRGQRRADSRRRRRPRGPVGDAARHLDRVEEPVLARGLLPQRRSSRSTASCGSYGSQRLRIYRMSPELGPPDARGAQSSAPEDVSWGAEWEHFADALVAIGRRCSATSTMRCTRGPGRRTPTRRPPPYAPVARPVGLASMARCRTASADLHPRRRPRHAAGRRRSTTRRSRCSRWPASRSSSISCACSPPTARRRPCSASATSAS